MLRTCLCPLLRKRTHFVASSVRHTVTRSRRTALCRRFDFVRKNLRESYSTMAETQHTEAKQQKIHENRLAKEKSPYLLQHKNNPVDWFPWGEEAIAKAKKESKPIFLSVGYSTCHWCHVMERESFENEQTAGIMNELFVNIKVDREERPDIDKIYMSFVQATTGGGGWPMSVFLSPTNLKPFYGGTYFPPRRQYGRPSFTDLLQRISHLWKQSKDELIEQADKVMEAIKEQEVLSGATRTGEEMSLEDLQDVLVPNLFRQIARGYDDELGGFSRAPKFPRPVVITGALHYWHQTKNAPALEMVEHTLRAMAEGGMYDHLGGGFHRYSVTADWQIPHFEKMLYDQAQLVTSYLEAFQITANPFYAQIARETLQYVMRDMTAPGGGFFSAEDADSPLAPGSHEKGEGAFYIWTMKELQDLLPEEDAKAFIAYYGIKARGNVDEDRDPHGEFTGRNIVWKVASLEDVAKSFGKSQQEVAASLKLSRQKLFKARAGRPKPHLDDKVLTSWNGLMISTFAKAFQVLNDKQYLEAAIRAANFIKRELYHEDQGILYRNFREGRSNIRGFADDYAFLITALLDLFEASFDPQWLQWALRLQTKMDELFWDRDRGGYFGAEKDDPYHVLRMKEDYDGAEPSPNSFAAMNLVRLSNMLHNESMREKARQLFGAFRVRVHEAPIVLPHMTAAAALFGLPPKQVVVAGKLDDSRTQSLLRTVYSTFDPHRVLLLADGAACQNYLKSLGLDFLQAGDMTVQGKPAAYVCENFVCQMPVTDNKTLESRLRGDREISSSGSTSQS